MDHFTKGRSASVKGLYDDAIFYYTEGVKQGCLRCMLALSGRLMDNASRHYNPAQSVALVKQAAEKDHPEALNVLGDWYRAGFHDIPQDLTIAIGYYKKAAAFQYPEAMMNLGQLKIMKRESAEESKKGLQLIKDAAYMGYPPAFYIYAVTLRGMAISAKASRVPPPTEDCNFIESLTWLLFAAEAGIQPAEKIVKSFSHRTYAFFNKGVINKAKKRMFHLTATIKPYDAHPGEPL